MPLIRRFISVIWPAHCSLLDFVSFLILFSFGIHQNSPPLLPGTDCTIFQALPERHRIYQVSESNQIIPVSAYKFRLFPNISPMCFLKISPVCFLNISQWCFLNISPVCFLNISQWCFLNISRVCFFNISLVCFSKCFLALLDFRFSVESWTSLLEQCHLTRDISQNIIFQHCNTHFFGGLMNSFLEKVPYLGNNSFRAINFFRKSFLLWNYIVWKIGSFWRTCPVLGEHFDWWEIVGRAKVFKTLFFCPSFSRRRNNGSA